GAQRSADQVALEAKVGRARSARPQAALCVRWRPPPRLRNSLPTTDMRNGHARSATTLERRARYRRRPPRRRQRSTREESLHQGETEMEKCYAVDGCIEGGRTTIPVVRCP